MNADTPRILVVDDEPDIRRLVCEILEDEGIYLHRARSWCISTDPEFTEKSANIIGLYLNPPINALVISVDEKPGIQALERATGFVETRDRKIVAAYKSTYRRQGTINLFAALDVATGHIKAQATETKKREDFQSFRITSWRTYPKKRRCMLSWIIIAPTRKTMLG